MIIDNNFFFLFLEQPIGTNENCPVQQNSEHSATTGCNTNSVCNTLFCDWCRVVQVLANNQMLILKPFVTLSDPFILYSRQQFLKKK